MKSLAILLAAMLLLLPDRAGAEQRIGSVVDAATGRPIAGATVTVGGQVMHSDAEGRFAAPDGATPFQVRAVGYGRRALGAEAALEPVKLTPLVPKALYLTVYGIGAPFLRDPALEVIDKSKLNALVIDLKGDRGLIPYPSQVPLAARIGALKVRTVPELDGLVRDLKARGIYLIARIVTFKDDLLATAHPEWAIKLGGAVWKDREGLAWLDPFRREAWDYSLSIAEEVAAAGFDEIQFDYIRFPDAAGLVFSQPNDEASRVATIVAYLKEAKRRLAPYNVFLAMDSFGYVCWNQNDTGIGQRLEDIAAVAEVISPMLYPSGFQFGIPGYRNPVEAPYEIVFKSLEECNRRTAGLPARYRPWLQAFPDYAFGGKAFGADEIAKQTRAARDAGSDGWMLWNPRNVYSTTEIRPDAP